MNRPLPVDELYRQVEATYNRQPWTLPESWFEQSTADAMAADVKRRTEATR